MHVSKGHIGNVKMLLILARLIFGKLILVTTYVSLIMLLESVLVILPQLEFVTDSINNGE